MSAFERARSSRRFFSLSSDLKPSHPGGVPAGSILTYTDTGERFIWSGDELTQRRWLPLVGVEDTVELLEDILSCLQGILRENQVTRASVATMANDQSDGDYPTDNE